MTGLAISGVRLSVPRYLAALQAAAFRATPVGRLNRRERVRIEDLRIEKQHLIAVSRGLAEIDLASSASLIRAPSVVFAPSRDWFARRHASPLRYRMRA